MRVDQLTDLAVLLGCDGGWQPSGGEAARSEAGEMLAQHPSTAQAVATLLV